MNKSEALDRLRRIRELISEFGRPNEPAKDELLRITRELKAAGSDNQYFAEKLASLERLADVGFSARKHKSVAGAAAQVRVFALADLGTATSVAQESTLFPD